MKRSFFLTSILLLLLAAKPASAQIVYTESTYPPMGYATFGLTLVDSTSTTKTYNMYLNLPDGVSPVNIGSIWALSSDGQYFYIDNTTGNSSSNFTVTNTATDLYLQWIVDYMDGTWQSYEGEVSPADLLNYLGEYQY